MRITAFILSSLLPLCSFAQSSTSVPLLDGECWWGAATNLGPSQPFTVLTDSRVYDLHAEDFNNQSGPILVSNRGRYIVCDAAYTLQVTGGNISMGDARSPISLRQQGSTLREAYLAAAGELYPPTGQLPPAEFFDSPIYNSWIELMYDQNQADIMRYAHAIIDNGMKPGVLMIDDNWQRDYGDWEFRAERFPNPKAMIDELHAMGFKVMLWVCPFVSPDCKMFRDMERLGYLVGKREAPSEAVVMRWWNGYSGCYDLSNPAAYACLKEQLVDLQRRYGVDGFKFDAGDPERYQSKDVSAFDGKSYDVDQARLWAEFAAEFPYNELRACWGLANRPLVQRLGDKPYSWKGVSDLVPAMIGAGLLGYAYTCPDMIGGGDYATFLGVRTEDFDPTLIIRSCQIHALMPMMQFSVAPWRILRPEHMDIVRSLADFHVKMGPYILEQARHAAATGEPIVRAMAYSFPGEGLDEVMDQYMLGERYLVCPVTTPDNQRTVSLPKGKWRDELGKTYKGGRSYTLDVPLERIPYFEKIR